MEHQGLLSLPTELLDRIYGYLDWDRSTTLCPIRPDLFSISLACNHLRQTVIPLVFRNVTLCLRWADGVLLEPALYRLRRQRPDLAQHVRSVFVVTALGYRPGTATVDDVPAFRFPDDTNDWLSPEVVMWPESNHHAELNAAHRKRVDSAVHNLLVNTGEEPSPTESPPTAEVLVRQMVERTSRAVSKQRVDTPVSPSWRNSQHSALAALSHADSIGSSAAPADEIFDDRRPSHVAWRSKPESQKLKIQLDSLAAVMLCFPATITELIFEAGIHGHEKGLWYTFAVQLGLDAMRIFGPRLEALTMAMGGAGSRRFAPLLSHPNSVETTSPDTITELTNLRRLVLATTAAPPWTFSSQNLHMTSAQLEPWKAASVTSTVTTLEIWNTHFTEVELFKIVDMVKVFQSLKILSFHNVHYTTHGPPPRIQPQNTAGPQGIPEATWLQFAILLRRAIPPATGMTFSDIDCFRGLLPGSALHWLMTEAVPAGVSIDHQREERLFEDYESFLDLWRAEDGERGRLAREERKSGELIDAAMCSRWKLFENVRKDQGEWTTI